MSYVVKKSDLTLTDFCARLSILQRNLAVRPKEAVTLVGWAFLAMEGGPKVTS